MDIQIKISRSRFIINKSKEKGIVRFSMKSTEMTATIRVLPSVRFQEP